MIPYSTEIKEFKLPDVPRSWIIALLAILLIALRFFGIDTFVTAGLSAIITWLVAIKFEQTRKSPS